MGTCINSTIYPNKNQDVFPLGLVHVVYQMMQGNWYAWAPYIIAQIYNDLHNFVIMKKSGKRVAHSFVLQFWAYEHIIMVQPRELPVHTIPPDHPIWY